MPTAEEFDEFYVSTRRGLVLQTFALTGDLAASRSAVRDAYVAARHHWEKLGRTEDPMSWVRPRAWSRAQRRHTVRPWHRERHVDADQTATLEALHQLPDAQRRTLVLCHLTDLGLDVIAREIGLPLVRVEELFALATTTVTGALECAPEEVPGRLLDLEPAADTVKLPRPTIVRRNGLRRRRNFAVGGSIAIAALMIAVGSFVATGTSEPASASKNIGSGTRAHVTAIRSLLLKPDQIAALAPGQTWTVGKPNRNNGGLGINTICQKDRFADKQGLGTWVQKFATAKGTPHALVQTVEISRDPTAAKTAYEATLGWYASCSKTLLVQLADAYRVTGLGDEAEVLQLKVPGRTNSSYTVGIARTGSLTVSTVLQAQTTAPPPAGRVSTALSTSVKDLCATTFAGTCVSTIATRATTPPPSGETAGMLAATDLPALSTVTSPWAGTQPKAAVPNPAATICDKADFIKGGASKPLSRRFVITSNTVPALVGITESIGKFGSSRSASTFVTKITSRMKACPDKELSSSISKQVLHAGTAREPSYALWRLINQGYKTRRQITYWTGVIRIGPYVAQVTMTPLKNYDVTSTTFAALLLRARDRLVELP